jgi:hypothetical protein
MLEVLMFSIFVTAILGIITLFYKHQSNLIKIQKKEFNFTDIEKISVQITISSWRALTFNVPFTIQGELFLRNNFMYVAPRQSILSSLMQHNLPIIFTRDKHNVEELTKMSNIVEPDSISFLYPNSVKIEYSFDFIGKVNQNIIIELLEESDTLKLQTIKNWCQHK